ncbi:sentrin-specific protease 6 [Tachyglossus aculeatus]|uniref:sentrin-specific protease 6 n=1 Tax=Tachyglossus aculeatus TaxID=9261 RepID=UPI0018F76EFE|nr:sentrin-specific protease 6 [Tachyglossus aculeatus]
MHLLFLYTNNKIQLSVAPVFLTDDGIWMKTDDGGSPTEGGAASSERVVAVRGRSLQKSGPDWAGPPARSGSTPSGGGAYRDRALIGPTPPWGRSLRRADLIGRGPSGGGSRLVRSRLGAEPPEGGAASSERVGAVRGRSLRQPGPDCPGAEPPEGGAANSERVGAVRGRSLRQPGPDWSATARLGAEPEEGGADSSERVGAVRGRSLREPGPDWSATAVGAEPPEGGSRLVGGRPGAAPDWSCPVRGRSLRRAGPPALSGSAPSGGGAYGSRAPIGPRPPWGRNLRREDPDWSGAGPDWSGSVWGRSLRRAGPPALSGSAPSGGGAYGSRAPIGPPPPWGRSLLGAAPDWSGAVRGRLRIGPAPSGGGARGGTTGGGGGGRGGGRESLFLEALDRSQSKRDGGFKTNWSFDNAEESEGDTEKDEPNLLSEDENDGPETSEGKRPQRYRLDAVGTSAGDSFKTYARRSKIGPFRTLKGNSLGLNMLNSKKLSENSQNVSLSSGTVLHGRRFHHANAQIPVMKTAAQSSLDQKERKEYPAHVQKIEIDRIRLPRPPSVDSLMEKTDGSGSESEPEVKRKGSEKNECCPQCGKEDETQTKCQSCGSAYLKDFQRHCRHSVALNESGGPLSRSSIHPSSGGEKSPNTGLNAKKFYGSTFGKVDVLLNRGDIGQNFVKANGKVLLSGSKIPKMTNLRPRNTRPSDLNDPIVLSSDDEEDDDSGSSHLRESISPRPADLAHSSPVPSTGKVEAAFKENNCGIEQRLGSSAADAELPVTIPRKARMKDQFGNAVSNTPVKRRKVTAQETDAVSLNCPSSYESVILNCRSIRIGTLRRMVVEPVIFCLDYIKIRLEESESDTREINLRTSELTKCEWCSVRKLPVVFLQTVPAACHSLRIQLKMSKEKDSVWYDCKGANPEEQYIILIFETGLDTQANMVFENIITDIGVRNNVSDFFVKIPFEEANGRLVAFTKTFEEVAKGNSAQKENKIKNVAFESKVQLRSTAPQFQFFDDEDEIGEPHNVFIGPVEKLIVYPPPPAKGGISVTNEDLHCLNEGEFLNDVIIDFYLKYLVLEKLKKEDADRIHIFSSFFYKRLNQKERRNVHETPSLSIQQKRHGRVKTWTRHVDIFEKDFIFVPLNEAAHWFLAVVCFPGLDKPKYEPNPQYRENPSPQLKGFPADSCAPSPVGNDMDGCPPGSPVKPVLRKTLGRKLASALMNSGAGTEENESPGRGGPGNGKSSSRRVNRTDGESEELKKIESPCPKGDNRTKDENGRPSEYSSPLQRADGLNKIRLSYSDELTDSGKSLEDELIDFSEDRDNQEDSSDDGGLTEENCGSELGQWHLKPTICKQPCILLMDSLRGPSRSNIVKILREYLEVEWEVRKGSKRSFSKDVMKGLSPKVPQQNNFSDCGVYILQYVESFFENPILNFELPMNLTDWFPRPRMKTKREEIRNIILRLQEGQNRGKKGPKDAKAGEATLQDRSEQGVHSSSD